MDYRDDRGALRERNETLEAELAAAREELAQEKARAADASDKRRSAQIRRGVLRVAKVAFFGGVVAAIGWSASSLVTRLPRKCGLNEEITVSGKRFDGPGPVIDVTDYNCKLTIRDSHLKSDVVVRGNQNLTLNIVNSTLEGSEAVLDFDTSNADINMSQHSVLLGKVGIRGKINTSLHMKDSKIIADMAIVGRDNFELDAADSEIRGRITAVDAKNPVLHLRRSTLSASEGTAIQTELNTRIEAEQSTIEGGDSAIACPLNLDMKLVGGSRVHGVDVAVAAPQNAKISITDSAIESDGIALSLREGNGDVRAGKGARIMGKKTAIRGGGGLTLGLDRALVQAEDVAISGDNLRLTAKNSQILGATAFALGRMPSLELDDDTVVRGVRAYPVR
jgi:hypothetical protein